MLVHIAFRDSNHNYLDIKNPIKKQGLNKGKIEISDDVWLGAHVVVLKDVKIGRGCVIAAHSLVNRNIPKYEVWGGIPAKFLKTRGGKDDNKDKK